MKPVLLLAFLMASLQPLMAQVAISNPSSNPDPSAMLDIKSTTKGMLIPRMTSAQRTAIAAPATGLMVYETTSNSVMVYNGSTWAQLGSGGSGTDWLVNGTHIYNGNTGNVGIGINSPTAKLHLAGLMKIDGGQIDIDDNIGKVRLLYNGSPKGYFSLSSSTGDIQIGTYITSNDDGKLQLETRGSPRLTILPNGNVGIGTITPDAKLHVSGNTITTGRIDMDGVLETKGGLSAIQGAGLYVTGSSLQEGNITTHGNISGSGTASIAGNINSNTSISINDAAAILTLKNSTGDMGFMQLSGDDVRVGTFSGNDLGKYIVRVNGTNTITVTPSNNVGIGTEVPTSKLHVAGRIFANGNGEIIKLDGANPNIGFYQGGTYRSFISQSGNNLFLGVNGGSMQLDAVQIAIGGVVPAASGYKLTVTGKAICEELKVKLSSSWPDYVFKKDYRLLSLKDLENFIKQNHHLPNIPKATKLEQDGMEVGDMQKRMMEKIEELTLYIIDLQKQINQLKEKSKK